MTRGAFHHALIIPATFLSNQPKEPGNGTKRLRREALYDSEDLARHLGNYVMNQIPTLSVSHISSKDIIAPDIWLDPFRVYACLFAKASRILFLVTQQDVNVFSDFITQLLQPFLKQAEALNYYWKSRFLVVAMGEFRLPESLPCEVIRFREIGWFRDSMALFVLSKKIQEFWTPIYDLSDSIVKTERLQFVTNVEETETFKASMYVKSVMDEDKTMMQKNDEENISVYEHEGAQVEDDILPFAASQNFSFRIEIESDRLLDINELLFPNNSLSSLSGIIQPDSRYFSSRSEIGFTGSSSDTEDGALISEEACSTSDSVGEMRWSSPDSVSVVQKADINALPSPNDDEHTIITNDQEDTSVPTIIEEPKIEAPKPAKRKLNVSNQIRDRQTIFSELGPKEADVLSSTETSPELIRKSLADMPLEAIQERSIEEDGIAYQSTSEIQGIAELPHSTSFTKPSIWRELSSSDLPMKESAGYKLELESPHLEERGEKFENYSAELVKSSSIGSRLPKSASEATDEFTRSEEQKLFIATGITSGYNTITSTGGLISQSGLSALDQLSFYSPREETTISDEHEPVIQSPLSYLLKTGRKKLNIDMRNRSLTDDEIKKNDSLSSKVSEVRTSSAESPLALRTKAGGGSRKQETLTSFSVQADLLTQSKESKTDEFTTVTNLDDEYLNDTYVDQSKQEFVVPIKGNLMKKSDSVEDLSVNTDKEFGMTEKPSVSEPAFPENANKNNTTSEWLPESVAEILPEAGSIKEERNSSSVTQAVKKQMSELPPTKDEGLSDQPTQAIDKQSVEWNTRRGNPPNEAVQFTKLELMPEESTVRDSQAPPPAKNTSEIEGIQQSNTKTIERESTEITAKVADLDSSPNVQKSSSLKTESKSVIELRKKDPVSISKQITSLDDASITSSPRIVAESRRKNAKETPLLTGESFHINGQIASFETKTALSGENAKEIGEKPEETSSGLDNERIHIAGAKKSPDVAKTDDSENINLVNTVSTKVDISESQEINKSVSLTGSDEMNHVKEKSYDEITSNKSNLNSSIIKKDKEKEVLQGKKNESHLDIPLDYDTVEAIETAHLTPSIPSGNELSKPDAKVIRKESSTISSVHQKSSTSSFSKSFKIQKMTITKRVESETDGDVNDKMHKSETVQVEEKRKIAAGDQAENYVGIPVATGKVKDAVDMANETKLKEGTEMMRDKVEEIQSKSNSVLKPDNVPRPLTDTLKYETDSSKSVVSDKRVFFQGDDTKSTRLVEQSSRYSPVNEETPQYFTKNIQIQSENSDYEYTAVPLSQVSVESKSLPLIFIRKSTLEQTNKFIERRKCQTNAKPKSQRSENHTFVEESSTDTLKQPTRVTVIVNTTEESPEPAKQIGSGENEIVMTKPLTADSTPRESPWEKIGEDNNEDDKKSKEEMEINVIKKNATENAQLGKFPMPLKCASPFSDSDCDPEITSWTMARPWYLLASSAVSQSHVPPVISPRTRSAAVKSSSSADKNDQKGNKQSSMLTPKFYPTSASEAMKTEATPVLRRNSEAIKARAEQRFSSISISDGEDQKVVEVVDAETGSTSSRSRVCPISGTTPFTLLHEKGEYKRNLSTQVSKKEKNQGSVTLSPYYRQIDEEAKQTGEALITYWRDRAVGSPTPLQFSVGSDTASDLSTSEISCISSKDLDSAGEFRDGTVKTLLSLYKALGKASKILADSNKVILREVEQLKKKRQ